MKAFAKEYRVFIVGVISSVVFWIMMWAAFQQNYNFIQAYGVSVIFAWASTIISNDIIKVYTGMKKA